MGLILGFVGRILAILPLSVSSLIGIIQVAIKLVKEILTMMVNVLFPLFPDGGKFETFVLKLRSTVDKVDAGWEKIKVVLLQIAGAVDAQK